MPDSQHFQLLPHVGLTADGNPEPLNSIAATVLVPKMIGGEIAEVPQSIHITAAETLGRRAARIIPGTRIVEVTDAVLAQTLLDTGQYEQIEAPTKAAQKKAQSQTTDAAAEAGTHEQE